ncbi:contact-dependent growth inhibition system immunity protein [Lentzea sp. NPDC060358]|uniref:contact-dependent growth inhibition system immunity protein n=1 Tax=Lentzea sp. NPDC060358 TaxID=3347103 RepID=UPI003652D7DF
MVDSRPEDLSLEQIEESRWGDPPPDATHLVATAYRLRRIPLRELTPEDLRLLLGQREGLAVLVPRALTLLEEDPLLEGDLYPGDVLSAVLRVPDSRWSARPTERARLERIAGAVEAPDADLRADIEDFRGRTGG